MSDLEPGAGLVSAVVEPPNDISAMGYLVPDRVGERMTRMSETAARLLLRETDLRFAQVTMTPTCLNPDGFRVLQKAISSLRVNLTTSNKSDP